MALRTDTGWQQWADRTLFMPKKDITRDVYDGMFDDQDFSARAGVMIYSVVWPSVAVASGTYTETHRAVACLQKHYMFNGTSGGTITCTPYVKAWNSAADNFSIRMTQGGTGTPTSTVTVSSSQTSKIFRAMSSINIYGAENTVTVGSMSVAPNFYIEAKRDAGTGYVFVAAFMLVVDQI